MAALTDFDEIVRTQRARVSRALLRFGVARRDLADAEQDVFLVVHRRLHEFEGRASIATWVYRIAMNVASDHRRRAHHRRELMCEERVLSAPSVNGSHGACALEQRETLERIADAVDTLERDKREVFLLYELDELPMTEIAAKLRLPLKTAFSRLYAARRALFGLLRDQRIALLALWQPRRLQLAWLTPAALCVLCVPGLAPQPAPPAAEQAARPALHVHVERKQYVVTPPMAAATTTRAPETARPSGDSRGKFARAKRALPARVASEPLVAAAAAVLDTPTLLAFSSYHTGLEDLRPRVLPELALARDSGGPSLPRIVLRGPRPATLTR